MKKKNAELYEYLQRHLPNGGISESSPLNSTILLTALDCKLNDKTIVKKAEELRKIEQKARNTAAHEIVSVTDEWLQNRVGYSTKQAVKLLKEFMQQVCSGVKSEVWNSYDEMNQAIIDALTKK